MVLVDFVGQRRCIAGVSAGRYMKGIAHSRSTKSKTNKLDWGKWNTILQKKLTV